MNTVNKYQFQQFCVIFSSCPFLYPSPFCTTSGAFWKIKKKINWNSKWKKYARREFSREILYKNIAIIAIQHSKMYFIDTFGDFSHTVGWNSLKSIWQISLYIIAQISRVEGSYYHTVRRHSVLIFFVYIIVAKFAISVWRFSPYCVVKFTIVYSTNYKTASKSIVWELLPYSICRILPRA